MHPLGSLQRQRTVEQPWIGVPLMSPRGAGREHFDTGCAAPPLVRHFDVGDLLLPFCQSKEGASHGRHFDRVD